MRGCTTREDKTEHEAAKKDHRGARTRAATRWGRGHAGPHCDLAYRYYAVKLRRLIERLEQQDIALVSDAGMPGLSDPGYPLIKAALALHHGKIPPSLNFRNPNPKIDFAASPFFVNTECRDWPREERPRHT